MQSTQEDVVTGARVDVERAVGLPAARIWDLITDVSRIGEWSPECVYGAWLTDERTPPQVGARFEGRNRFRSGFTSSVECVVTESDWPTTFGWVVLDGDRVVARPGSMWRYELLPGNSAGQTLVRHSFVHGPGFTGLRAIVEEGPAQGAAHLSGRLADLRQNMTVTLEAMTRG